MSSVQEPVQFEIDEFERVSAGAGVALLRLAGRWRYSGTLELDAPTLIIEDGRGAHHLRALPGPDATSAAAPNGRPWRAAFSVPVELLDGSRTAFVLDAGAAIVELPRPSEPRRSEREERYAGGRYADEVERLRGAIDELEERLAEALEARAEVEAQLAEELEVRGELEALLAAQAEARADADVRLAQLSDGVEATPTKPPPPSQPSSLPSEWVVGLALLLFGVSFFVVVVVGVLN
jgi:hypothetical protein